MAFKAVIFDMDGTLIDSVEGIAYSMNSVLEKQGFPTHSSEMYKSFIGNGVGELVKKALKDHGNNEKVVSKSLQQMKEEYQKKWDYKMTIYEGIEALLDFLEDRDIYCAVNTNKDEEVARIIVDKYLSKWTFSHIIGNNPDIPRKPDPTGAMRIAEKLGFQPEECIYLGDSEVDVMTGNNANMFSVGALWGFRKKEDLICKNPRKIIKHPLDLMDLFS